MSSSFLPTPAQQAAAAVRGAFSGVRAGIAEGAALTDAGALLMSVVEVRERMEWVNTVWSYHDGALAAVDRETLDAERRDLQEASAALEVSARDAGADGDVLDAVAALMAMDEIGGSREGKAAVGFATSSTSAVPGRGRRTPGKEAAATTRTENATGGSGRSDTGEREVWSADELEGRLMESPLPGPSREAAESAESEESATRSSGTDDSDAGGAVQPVFEARQRKVACDWPGGAPRLAACSAPPPPGLGAAPAWWEAMCDADPGAVRAALTEVIAGGEAEMEGRRRSLDGVRRLYALLPGRRRGEPDEGYVGKGKGKARTTRR
ncbi:hypothetical protein DFH11DRAFT_1546527 [Phellopilus nigrolimitatus]|nr:hypothetical protein DFH11DRAFT_1546527 [Phellopilus nigrolimitatus]